MNGPFQVAYSKLSIQGDDRLVPAAYIADLSVMSAPCVGQLPLPIFMVPDLNSMIRRSCQNAIAIEIKLGDSNQVAMARVEVGEPSHFARVR